MVILKKSLFLKNNKDTILVFFLTILIFYLLIEYSNSDIRAHLKHVVNINSGISSYPPNFLYYLLVNMLSGFTSNFHLLLVSAIIVLASSVTLKYMVTKYIITDYLAIKGIVFPQKSTILVSIGLLFFFSIPDYYCITQLEYWYSCRFPPHVWHNSTILLVFPFAILLFWKQYKLMNFKTKNIKKELMFLSMLVIINIIIKPSFLFAFIPITGLYILKKYWSKGIKTIFIFLSPSIIGTCLILASYFLIFHFQTGTMHDEKSSIYISNFFEIFNFWMPNWYIPISLIISFIFPILFYLLYSKYIKDSLTQYTLLIVFFSILISAFIMEDGPRKSHGNFIWQNVIAVYIIELVTTLHFITVYRINSLKNKKIKLLSFIFLLHSISGIAYLIKTIFIGNYF